MSCLFCPTLVPAAAKVACSYAPYSHVACTFRLVLSEPPSSFVAEWGLCGALDLRRMSDNDGACHFMRGVGLCAFWGPYCVRLRAKITSPHGERAACATQHAAVAWSRWFVVHVSECALQHASWLVVL